MHPLPIIVLFIYFSQAISARDTITPTHPLAYNETLVSADGRFALGFFTPGQSKNHYLGLWYNNITDKTPVWVANRNNPVTSSSAGLVSISGSGELRITDQNSTLVWSSGAVTNVMTNPIAQLLNSGNLVVRDAGSSDGEFAWQGFDYPTDTLIAGMKMGVDLVTGLNRTLTAWTSESDPSPSQYYTMMDIHGDPELLLCSGSKKVYRTGPWNGLQFTSIPARLIYHGINISFINNKKEISYSFNTVPSVLAKVAVNQSGVLKRSLWVEGSGLWNTIWYAPMDVCDYVAACGPFATCDPNNPLICDCIQGFKPKSLEQWTFRDWTGGCIRKTRLDCQNGTDGFHVIPNSKLPDTSNVTVNRSLSVDGCRLKCLSTCSCTAYAPADVRNGGSGCIIWTSELSDLKVITNNTDGQELYVRLAAADLGQSPATASKSNKWIYILVIILSFFMLILAYVGILMWRTKRRRMRAAEEINTPFHDRSIQGFVSGTDLELSKGTDFELPLLDLNTVAFATDNFSAANKLGEGGFGPVFKGKLGNGEEIAVKRLAKTSLQGLVEFKNEVLLIAKLQHRNLVRLLACCIEADERILIYEYMPNKSLDHYLFEKSIDQVLDWQTRFKIIMGITRGLLYLHQDSRLRIIHRDLKASNILLDEAMNPKISDFGMARIFCGDETVGNTIKIVGTFGYMSPEYIMNGIFSQKSDVFSFGVLVLEIITGKKNRGEYAPCTNLLDHVWTLWKEGISMQMVDESMNSYYSMNEVMRCIKVGLLCVQNHPEDRPFMSSVLVMLSGDNALIPNPKEPGFTMRDGVPYQTKSSSSKGNPSPSYDMSVTIIEGR